jgi:hypothetical protein
MKIFFAATLLLALHGSEPSVAPHLRGEEHEQRALAKSKKVDICHIPPGNPSNFHTINISEKAVQSHLDHGDLEGRCSDNCGTLCRTSGDMCEIHACQDKKCLGFVMTECDDVYDSTEEACNPVSGFCEYQIVAPNSLKNLDADYYSDGSFCLEGFNQNDLRQQNFYSSDQFEALSGPMLITEVALRIARIPGDFPVQGPIIYPQTVTYDAEFRLSTTPHVELEDLSTTFSKNYGDDVVLTVLRDETWALITNGNDRTLEKGVPNPFDIIIKLDTPYLYDPSKGNLNFEYIIHNLETINCKFGPIITGESAGLGPWIDSTPTNPEYFNKVRILYSFNVTSPEGLFEQGAPVVRFTFTEST